MNASEATISVSRLSKQLRNIPVHFDAGEQIEIRYEDEKTALAVIQAAQKIARS
jgi:hypothetical protein